MIRSIRRMTFLSVAILLALGTSASAKKKKAGGTPAPAGSPAPAAGGDDMTFDESEASGGAAPAGPPSPVMARAIKLYDKGDYYSSSIEFFKVLSDESGDSPGNKQRAEHFMGRALYNMKFYSAALSYFDRIVQQGANHAYYGAALKWLAALSLELPEQAGILEKIGKYQRADLEQSALSGVRDHLYFLLGRHYYNKGEFDAAIELFGSVPEDSTFYSKAKFFEGITYVRKYDGGPAIEAFKRVLERAAQKKKDVEQKEFVELANLSMARVFYSTKQFNLALKYFDKIPQDSPDWLHSLFESSWAYFMLKSYSRTLGNIHTLNAPYFEQEFFPESLILRAVVYYRHCRYDRAEEATTEFQQTYVPLRKELLAITKKYEDNAEFYGYVKKIRNGSAGLPDRVTLLSQSALNDRQLLKSFSYVDELKRELRQVDRADPAWKSTAVAAEIQTDLELQKSLAEGAAGELARDRIKRLATEIGELTQDAIKIDIETLNAKANEITAELRKEQVPAGPKDSEQIVVDDEHQYWPFNGEYWKDELGMYRYKVSSACEQAGKKK